MEGRVWALARAALMGSLLAWLAAPASAQLCGSEHVLREGETLAEIAQRVYGSSGQWTAIYYSNQDRLGSNATLMVPGTAIRIPCLGQAARPATPAPSPAAPPAPVVFELSSMVRRLEFLTAEGYPPFADRTLPNGGLLPDLLSASMDLIKAQGKGAFDYRVSWVNDWAAHLNPLLITRAFDAGVPWLKPDCSSTSLDRASQYKCQKFFFSDPLYETVNVLFVKSNSPITFKIDEEILGKTLCRTRGWSTFDLDKGGRNWLQDSKVTLMQPQTLEECFRLLEAGTVDAVVVSDLSGKAVAAAMGLSQKVRPTERPVNIETMHVIVAKTHPHARTILYYVNSSLAKLKEDGEYDKIIARHLEQFWNALEPQNAALPGSLPAGKSGSPSTPADQNTRATSPVRP